MTLDLTTLEKIRADIKTRLQLWNNSMDIERCYIPYEYEKGVFIGMRNILLYLDTEIANATQASR